MHEKSGQSQLENTRRYWIQLLSSILGGYGQFLGFWHMHYTKDVSTRRIKIEIIINQQHN